MTKKAFIHLSDLHVAAKQRVGGVDNSERANKTWLVAQSDEDNHNYIKVFCDYVKKKYNGYDFFLLISGDISDMSEKNEYESAEIFLKQIMKELNVPKDHLLIVPGNHDINRKECQQEAESDSSKQAHLCNMGKYKYFAEFFHDVTGKDFPYNRAVVDVMGIDDEKIMFVGVNSNYKIGYVDGYGAVDIGGFRDQMMVINKNYNEYIKIALFHHNIVSDYEHSPSSYGSFKKDDWLNFKDFEDLDRKGDNLGVGHRCVVNKKTGLRYKHDFPLTSSIKDYWPEFTEKYNRRIKRMYYKIEKAKRILLMVKNWTSLVKRMI